jgi:hypothetical protein
VIDWRQVVTNGLWVAGLAVVLSAWSYFRSAGFARRPWVASRTIGLALFAIGFATMRAAWYEHLAWAIVAAWITFDGWRRWRAID